MKIYSDISIDYALTQAYNMNQYFIINENVEIRIDNKLTEYANDPLLIAIDSSIYDKGKDFDNAVMNAMVDFMSYMSHKDIDNSRKYQVCKDVYEYLKACE